jgi:hypothetical protein
VVAESSAAWQAGFVVHGLAPPVANPYSLTRIGTFASSLAAAIWRVAWMCAITVATLAAYG